MENNANNTGWIKLHRKFLEWEWWEEPNMVRMFLTLILSANTEDKRWKGITIHRGQLVTSLSRLMIITCMSRKCVRTALLRLQKTNEIIVTRAQNFSIITICNYATYQDREIRQGHTNGTTKGISPTQQGAPTKEYKKKEYISSSKTRAHTCEVENLAEWLRTEGGDIWGEMAMIQLGLKNRGALDEAFEVYQRECIAQGVTIKETSDIRRHFMNLMRKKLKDEASVKNNTASSRPTKAERDAEVEAYVRSVLGGGDA